jgi:alpha-glucosidase (family GH31 glycosyl hydrolase)
LLVSPVYSGHSEVWNVRLPSGNWRDFWDGSLYAGGDVIQVKADIDYIPVFARAGAIIPLLDPSADTLLPVTDEPEIKVAGNDLRLQIYPGSDGTFQMYDGSRFTWNEGQQTLVIDSHPVSRCVSVRMMSSTTQTVKVVDYSGGTLPIHTTSLNGDPDHYRFFTQKHQTYQVRFT